MYSGGRTGGWRGCSPPRGPKLLGASLQPGPKIVDLKKKLIRTHTARTHPAARIRTHSTPTRSLASTAVMPALPPPPPLLPGAPAGRLFSLRGSSSAPPLSARPPPATAAPQTAPPRRPPGQRGRPAGSQPASGQARRGAPTSAAHGNATRPAARAR